MCILNKEVKKKKLDVDYDEISEGVYTHRYSPEKLPDSMYVATALVLWNAVKKGFQKTDISKPADLAQSKLIENLKENIVMFSGAKTFQQTLEMSDALIDDEGNRRSFKDFKIEADKILEGYNENFLETEFNTAQAEARNTEKFESAEKNKQNEPFLMYKTTEGENVCDECGPLDGLIFNVDDEIWDEISPPLHFNCFCTVISMDEEAADENGGEFEYSENSPVLNKIVNKRSANARLRKSMAKRNRMFCNNPFKTGEIFKSTGEHKHPYFDVPEQYRELAQRNFDLPENIKL